MTTETASRRAYLAEHMSVECHFEVQTDDGGNDSYFCVDCFASEECLPGCPCHGSGRRYLLRRECMDTGRLEVKYCSDCASLSTEGCLASCRCSGLSHCYDDSPNALWNAVKEMGGTLRAWINYNDKFVAQCHLDNPNRETKTAEADTMTEALEMAVWSAHQ